MHDWSVPPNELLLPREEAHIWRISLEGGSTDLARFNGLLSEEEQARARRFHFDRDRERFIVAHGAMRTILGRYLNTEPNQIRFDHNSKGKPSLTGSRRRKVAFNLSHSHDLALCAVTAGREVGVDLEYLHREVEAESLAERFFSAGEAAALRATPKAQQQVAFLRIWTAKEAYIKARGEGIDLVTSLGEMASLQDDTAVLATGEVDGEWFLQRFNAGPDYVGALVVEGQRCHIRFFQFR